MTNLPTPSERAWDRASGQRQNLLGVLPDHAARRLGPDLPYLHAPALQLNRKDSRTDANRALRAPRKRRILSEPEQRPFAALYAFRTAQFGRIQFAECARRVVERQPSSAQHAFLARWRAQGPRRRIELRLEPFAQVPVCVKESRFRSHSRMRLRADKSQIHDVFAQASPPRAFRPGCQEIAKPPPGGDQTAQGGRKAAKIIAKNIVASKLRKERGCIPLFSESRQTDREKRAARFPRLIRGAACPS